MVKIAPRSAARFAEAPAPEAAVVLIYGPDRGQIGELAQAIIKAVAKDPTDPFRVAELTPAAIQDDHTLLGDEARALSLTGGRRAVRVRGAADALISSSQTLAYRAAKSSCPSRKGNPCLRVAASNTPEYVSCSYVFCDTMLSGAWSSFGLMHRM